MRSPVRKTLSALFVASVCALLVSSGALVVPRATYRDREVVVSARLLAPTPPAIDRCREGLTSSRHHDLTCLGPHDRRAFVRFVRLLALRAFYAALWAWDNPPSPGFVSWACVASSETVPPHYGVHGSEYSSAFGMMNQAVRDRADSPASAARILAGTATPGEERRAAWRELLAFGSGAWGALTRQKCAT